jgi:hypothetical protein
MQTRWGAQRVSVCVCVCACTRARSGAIWCPPVCALVRVRGRCAAPRRGAPHRGACCARALWVPACWWRVGGMCARVCVLVCVLVCVALRVCGPAHRSVSGCDAALWLFSVLCVLIFVPRAVPLAVALSLSRDNAPACAAALGPRAVGRRGPQRAHVPHGPRLARAHPERVPRRTLHARARACAGSGLSRVTPALRLLCCCCRGARAQAYMPVDVPLLAVRFGGWTQEAAVVLPAEAIVRRPSVRAVNISR